MTEPWPPEDCDVCQRYAASLTEEDRATLTELAILAPRFMRKAHAEFEAPPDPGEEE